MNLVYDFSIFGQRYGGISRYFHEVIRRIANDQDLNVYLFQGLYANEYPLNLYRNKYRFYFGFKRPVIPKTNRVFNRINELLFRVYLDMNKLDRPVYHPTYYLKNLKDIKNSVKVVLTVYDLICELYPAEFRNARKEIENKKTSINRADHIICLSESTKRDLTKFYKIPEGKISVIYLGSSLETDNIREDINSNITIPRPYILYIGHRRTAYKNFNLLLDAFIKGAFYKDFDLLCFGSGKFTQQELKYFKLHNIINSIHYCEGDDSFLANTYRNATCLVYPSLYEGFGLPVLEAMSQGCPVIASNTSSISEIVGDAAILFDPSSADSLIESLRRLLYSSEIPEVLSDAGYIQAAKFDWDITAQKTLQIYKALI